MADKFIGRLHHGSHFRKTERIYSTKIRIGEVEHGQSKIGSTIQMYVPSPTDIRHVPGVFITLSNSSGACFARIDPVDLDRCIQWMQGCRDLLFSAYESATQTISKLRQADKEAFEKAFPSENRRRYQRDRLPGDRQDPDIDLSNQEELQYFEEEGIRTLMAQQPFTP